MQWISFLARQKRELALGEGERGRILWTNCVGEKVGVGLSSGGMGIYYKMVNLLILSYNVNI